jgi:hypothetical protein
MVSQQTTGKPREARHGRKDSSSYRALTKNTHIQGPEPFKKQPKKEENVQTNVFKRASPVACMFWMHVMSKYTNTPDATEMLTAL